MRIASHHHGHATPLGLELCPAVGQSDQVLGFANLNRISIRNLAYRVPERMVRMKW